LNRTEIRHKKEKYTIQLIRTHVLWATREKYNLYESITRLILTKTKRKLNDISQGIRKERYIEIRFLSGRKVNT